jgi:hypothetical protein
MLDTSTVLPGLMRRAEYMRVVHNKTDFTGKRWQRQGLLVVRYIGKAPYVDLEATTRRMRGEDQLKRRRGV